MLLLLSNQNSAVSCCWPRQDSNQRHMQSQTGLVSGRPLQDNMPTSSRTGVGQQQYTQPTHSGSSSSNSSGTVYLQQQDLASLPAEGLTTTLATLHPKQQQQETAQHACH